MSLTRIAHTRALSTAPARARRELRSLLTSAAWPGDIEGVILAVHEALMNAAQHAGGITGVRVGLDGEEVVVEVSDRGPGFDVDRHTGGPPEPLDERGRGLWLISQIASDLRVDRQGGAICLRLCFLP